MMADNDIDASEVRERRGGGGKNDKHMGELRLPMHHLIT